MLNLDLTYLIANAANPKYDATTATRRHYVSQTRCEFTRLIGAGNGWSSIDYYITNYMVIENNTFDSQIGNEVTDGEMYLEIDGRVYGHIKNMFNRHWSNDGIEYISIFDTAQGGGSYTLYYDNMYLSTGGWRP